MSLLDRMLGRLTVEEAASYLREGALRFAASDAQTLIQPDQGHDAAPDPQTHWRVFLDCLCMYLHVIDRLAHQLLAPARRRELMDAMTLPIPMVLAKTFWASATGAQGVAIADTLLGTINEFQTEFSRYPLTSAEVAGLDGTLFWEFGKRVAADARNATGSVQIALGASVVPMGIRTLDVERVLKKVKSALTVNVERR